MKRNIKFLLSGLLIIVVFLGCSLDNDKTDLKITITSCNENSTSWTVVSLNDQVIADAQSQLKFDYDSSGNKKVCVLTGTAFLVSN